MSSVFSIPRLDHLKAWWNCIKKAVAARREKLFLRNGKERSESKMKPVSIDVIWFDIFSFDGALSRLNHVILFSLIFKSFYFFITFFCANRVPSCNALVNWFPRDLFLPWTINLLKLSLGISSRYGFELWPVPFWRVEVSVSFFGTINHQIKALDFDLESLIHSHTSFAHALLSNSVLCKFLTSCWVKVKTNFDLTMRISKAST